MSRELRTLCCHHHAPLFLLAILVLVYSVRNVLQLYSIGLLPIPHHATSAAGRLFNVGERSGEVLMPASLEDAVASFESFSHTLGDPSRIVWQTWKTSELPDNLRPHREILISSNRDYEFRLVGDTEADAFMRLNFAGPTYDAYRSINPALGAMRADLWRYCVLYVHGGIYLDVDASFDEPLREWVDDGEAILGIEHHKWEAAERNCRDLWKKMLRDGLPNRVPGGHIHIQWMMVYPIPRHPILWETIRLVTEHVNTWQDSEKAKNFSNTIKVLCLSGPPVLSAAAQNVFDSVGGNWTSLHARMGGFDFGGRAQVRAPGLMGNWMRSKGHYSKMDVPIKVAAH